MNSVQNSGLTAKFLSMLGDVNQSTISRVLQQKKLKQFGNLSKRNIRYPVEEARSILDLFVKQKHPIAQKRKVHAFYNFKGGTGKTTICYQVATHLSLCGYKVLIVDADAQGHLTVSFGYIDNLNMKTLYDALVNNISINEIIVPIFDGLDLIPGNLSLTNIDVRLREMHRQEDVLKRYMSSLRQDYDFIIFDCNPSMSSLNRNILNFSDVLDVVCETHPYSVNGMKLMMDDLERFYKFMENESLPDILIIPNKYEDRSSSSAEAMTVLNKYYSKYLVPNFAVRKSEDFPKSARDQLPLSFFCKSNSIAFEDISDLIRIIISKSELINKELFEVA
jgi:chromosome partitioning protein